APKSTDSYKDAPPGVGARFLVWVEKHYSSKIVDKVNHGCQIGTQASTTFKSVTGKTVDQLWKAYKADKKFKISLPLNR
ncbi:MAG: hypothetical protein J2P36_03985, partial [Ktedonobacteraceae bacterium]|nr:hypothetical protein [Ktedonobacteraceae bacterium]